MTVNVANCAVTVAKSLKEISHLTDMIAFWLLIIVGLAFIYMIIVLIILNKKTKRPKRIAKNYDNYLTAQAVITDIEKVPYYVEPYEKKNEMKTQVEKITADEVVYLIKEMAEKKEEEKPKEVEKFRYKVTYTFSSKEFGSGFYGEFYVNEESDDLKVGEKIEVKYDPYKPQCCFTEYNKPLN